jgi:hypothetical protein
LTDLFIHQMSMAIRSHTHTLALLNKLNIGRQSALWKWRLSRHAGRTHARSHAVFAGATISCSSSQSLPTPSSPPLPCYALLIHSQLSFSLCSLKRKGFV